MCLLADDAPRSVRRGVRGMVVFELQHVVTQFATEDILHLVVEFGVLWLAIVEANDLPRRPAEHAPPEHDRRIDQLGVERRWSRILS